MAHNNEAPPRATPRPPSAHRAPRYAWVFASADAAAPANPLDGATAIIGDDEAWLAAMRPTAAALARCTGKSLLLVDLARDELLEQVNP